MHRVADANVIVACALSLPRRAVRRNQRFAKDVHCLAARHALIGCLHRPRVHLGYVGISLGTAKIPCDVYDTSSQPGWERGERSEASRPDWPRRVADKMPSSLEPSPHN